ncbi:MAG: ATPase [Ardenticatenales bacterium]|nr:ATPase [Ardenticatenales bacterium]
MSDPSRPLTFLCLASELKGVPFLVEAHRQGCRTILVVAEAYAQAEWPWSSIDELFRMPDLSRQPDVTYGVSYLARNHHIDRIVALDDFDVETAADLREHLRIAGMGHTTARHFRDKLAMRVTARDKGILVPPFTGVFNYDDLRAFMADVPPPWVLKPRFEAGAIGIRKLGDAEGVWRALDDLGDKQSFYLLEKFVAGDVYHVDAIVWQGEVVFSRASRYGLPPLAVTHGGGVFSSRTLPLRSAESVALLSLNQQLMTGLGMVRGVSHSEYIRGAADGRFYFLETAARVGGANLDRMVAAASEVDLWTEAARLEIADVRGESYTPPAAKDENAGILICLSRQEHPDLSAYNDPEIVWRLPKPHHAGVIVASPDAARVEQLINAYAGRFAQDFLAIAPPQAPTRV